ncbi:hypothetical protein E2C01_023012 [Portunus trituberculatus]|uniref:Uncharacterized protein n=1 Tax=Portunus trituberculatus TaxID=210409 RepID=A0A5B7EA24_PORTR|nr:hypothetical protein [Portunus trituberculatus]
MAIPVFHSVPRVKSVPGDSGWEGRDPPFCSLAQRGVWGLREEGGTEWKSVGADGRAEEGRGGV